jgi:nucleoside-diphosphate-sugar epimerase
VEEVTEESPTEPIDDPYSAMHLVRERLFVSLTSTPVSVLRSTQICALNDTHDAYGPNRFRRTALSENRIVLFGMGEETRDHIMVEDVAAIIYRCLLHQSRGVMNVATGRSLTFAEVARQVSTHFEPRPEIVRVPRHMPVTHRRFDISVCVRAFPDLVLTPLEQGLPRMMQQMAAQREC